MGTWNDDEGDGEGEGEGEDRPGVASRVSWMVIIYGIAWCV